jgi:hypothetical protein
LIRQAKSVASWKEHKKETGVDFMKHNLVQYEESLKSLKVPQFYEFLVVDPDGKMVIRPGIMKLWTSHGDQFTPKPDTDAELMGLMIHVWLHCEPTLSIQEDMSDYNIVTFEDIADITYQYIDDISTRLLKPNVSKFLHKQCSAGRYVVFSITTEFDLSYHILACCLHGYDDAFIYLQNILLFLQSRKRLAEANLPVVERDGENNTLPIVAQALAKINE